MAVLRYTESGSSPAGALNYVKITGLQPDTRYYYTYGDLVSRASKMHFVVSPVCCLARPKPYPQQAFCKVHSLWSPNRRVGLTLSVGFCMSF